MYGAATANASHSSLVRHSEPVYVTFDCKCWLARELHFSTVANRRLHSEPDQRAFGRLIADRQVNCSRREGRGEHFAFHRRNWRAALARTGEDARAHIFWDGRLFAGVVLTTSLTPRRGASRAGSGIAGFSRPESGSRYRIQT